MTFIKLTDKGKCDVTWTFFNSDNSIIAQRTVTFDIKPTIKELKERFAIDGAKTLRLTTTPSGNVKTIKLK
jgi:hypothetical protein